MNVRKVTELKAELNRLTHEIHQANRMMFEMKAKMKQASRDLDQLIESMSPEQQLEIVWPEMNEEKE